MLFLYAVGIALTLSLLVFVVLNRWLKPVSKKKDRYVQKSKKAGRTVDEFTWRETRDQWMSIFSGDSVSEEFKEEMNRHLDRLGSKYRAKDIRQMQLLYTSLFLVATVLAFFLSLILGFVMLGVTYYIWSIPVNTIRSQIKQRNNEFLEGLNSLFTVIYNQYKRSNAEHLGHIIGAYYPTASPLMKKDLELVMRDVEVGEEFALRQLRQRIPHPLVLRFCKMIADNLEGYDNRNVMENFYMELKDAKNRRRRRKLEQKENRLGWIINMLYIPFGFLVVLYLLLFTLSSF